MGVVVRAADESNGLIRRHRIVRRALLAALLPEALEAREGEEVK